MPDSTEEVAPTFTVWRTEDTRRSRNQVKSVANLKSFPEVKFELASFGLCVQVNKGDEDT